MDAAAVVARREMLGEYALAGAPGIAGRLRRRGDPTSPGCPTEASGSRPEGPGYFIKVDVAARQPRFKAGSLLPK